jgi:hypothetical protein
MSFREQIWHAFLRGYLAERKTRDYQAQESNSDIRIWEATELCGHCATVDLSKLFTTKPMPVRGTNNDKNNLTLARDGNIPHTYSGLKPSICQLCRFFVAVAWGATGPSKQDLSRMKFDVVLLDVFEAFNSLLFNTVIETTLLYQSAIIGLQLTRSQGGQRTTSSYYILPVESTEHPYNRLPVSGRLLNLYSIDFGVLKGWLNRCKSHHGDLCMRATLEMKQLPDLLVIECARRETIKAPENCVYAGE